MIGLISGLWAIPAPAHRSLELQPAAVSASHLPARISQLPPPAPEQFQPVTWQPFTSDSGGYAVDFPMSPTQFTSTTEISTGTLTWQVAETRVQASESSSIDAYEYYLIAYTSLSADHLNNQDPDQLVKAVSDAVLSEGGLAGSIQLQEPILFHNHPAQLVIGTVENQYWVMVLSLVDGRLYTNLAFSQQRDRVVHFLDSFTFTNSPT